MERGQSLPERLRHARDAAGLTRRQVADWLGIGRPAVVEIENGKRALTSGELARLAALFGRSVSWFARGVPAPRDLVAAALGRVGERADPTLRREAASMARRYHLLARVLAQLGLPHHVPRRARYDDGAALGDRTRAHEHGHTVAHDLALAGYAKGYLGLGGVADIFGVDKEEMLRRLRSWEVHQEFSDDDALVGSPR